MKKIKVTCDNCCKEFKVKIKELAWHPDTMIRVEGFKCPKCGKCYITTVTDNDLRESMYRAKELEDQLKQLGRQRDYEYDSYINMGNAIPSRLKQRYADKCDKIVKELNLVLQYNKNRGEQLKKDYMRKE